MKGKKAQAESVPKSSKKPCDGCKSHHIKCDKNEDCCKNCYRRGIPCTYLIERKRRGPKTKVEHMVKYFESLNISQNQSQTPDILITPEPNENYNIQSTSDFNFSVASSPNMHSSIISDDILFQTSPGLLPMYQSIYNPMLDTSCYSLPLPLGFGAAISPLALPITTTAELSLSPSYSHLDQAHIQDPSTFDPNTYPLYFN